MSDNENNDPGEAIETDAETASEAASETTDEAITETASEETAEAGEENDSQEASEQEAIDRGAEQMAEMAAAMAAEGVGVESDVAPQVDIDHSTAESIARGISGEEVNIDTLLKVPVSLSIEVGRTKMPLGDLLDTKEGSVIELERMLDEPLDILVNGALIAHGVVVLANERFGLQITDIISLEERARSL